MAKPHFSTIHQLVLLLDQTSLCYTRIRTAYLLFTQVTHEFAFLRNKKICTRLLSR